MCIRKSSIAGKVQSMHKRDGSALESDGDALALAVHRQSATPVPANALSGANGSHGLPRSRLLAPLAVTTTKEPNTST
ncbi:hypothetical protein BDY19DRAFT_946855 [Irpex rosettiformis]|uniref:Uncharacterized protein n=1 Tax=Irpex rosettiformis TaxID=378272 RepID=A0ACB8U3V7_9APHY|nr:hypothetical protein BDY19DRAFT_946855 [Irpex rosettiformis]